MIVGDPTQCLVESIVILVNDNGKDVVLVIPSCLLVVQCEILSEVGISDPHCSASLNKTYVSIVRI